MAELFDDLEHLFFDLLVAACLLARHRILIFPFPFVISARAVLHDPAQTAYAEPGLLLIFFAFGFCDMIRLASNSNYYCETKLLIPKKA